MKFNLDFDNLEELRKKLETTIEAMEDFETVYSEMEDSMEDVAQAKSFENIFKKGQEMIDSLKELKENAEEQEENLHKYIEGIHNLNEPTQDTDYKIDTVEVESHMKKTIRLLEIDKVKISREFENDIEEIEDYYRKIDDQYDDMKADSDVKENDLEKARKKLDEAIEFKNDASNNEHVIEDLTRYVNDKYDDLNYIGEQIGQYLDVITDLEHFEGEFNPGFWKKYGNEVMIAISVVGMFAASPWSYILAGIEVAVALAKGEGVVAAATGFIPFEKAVGPLFKGATKVADKAFGSLAKLGAKAGAKIDGPATKCLIGG